MKTFLQHVHVILKQKLGIMIQSYKVYHGNLLFEYKWQWLFFCMAKILVLMQGVCIECYWICLYHWMSSQQNRLGSLDSIIKKVSSIFSKKPSDHGPRKVKVKLWIFLYNICSLILYHLRHFLTAQQLLHRMRIQLYKNCIVS